MKLKLDENIGTRFGEPLREMGHEVSSVAAQSMAGWQDRDLIRVCRDEGRCLVTLDLGFGNPLLYDPSAYPGIAVLRIPGKLVPVELLTAMQTLGEALADRPIVGKLWIVQSGRIREYQQE